MSRRLDELLQARGRLIERIAIQRDALERDCVPIAATLGKVDVVVSATLTAAGLLKRYATLITVLTGAFLIFKRKTALRWGRRAFGLWRSWRALQHALLG